MKTCPVCEVALDDSYLFCPEDGSSLGTPADAGPSDDYANTSDRKSESDPDSPVVLYCPTCAAEYPLTFTACPVHAAPLVKHAIPRLAAPATQENLQAPATERLTKLHLQRPTIDRSQHVVLAATVESDTAANHLPGTESSESLSAESLVESDSSEDRSLNSAPLNDGIHPFPSFDRDAISERPGFRVAAIATVAALALFGLVALYMFVANLSRRRVPPTVHVASQTEAASQAGPFVPTPQEARDYKEEPVVLASPPVSSPGEQDRRAAEKQVTQREPAPHKPVMTPPAPTPSTPLTGSAPARMTKVSTPPIPDVPRGNSGGFDARLVRVRSSRTSSGFRYELTFNMLEQAGRPTQWQRLLITTRSASGLSHSQAIPFVHRLGATGALTFTISVEMAGRSEADWQGRVVCTTLGWDNNDRPLQASFGANVTP